MHGIPVEEVQYGCTTVRVAIRDYAARANKGYMWYFHVTKNPGLGEFSIWVSSAGFFNNRHLGDFKWPDICYTTGPHVHATNNVSSTWRGWNEAKYDNANGQQFEVDDINNWTRYIAW